MKKHLLHHVTLIALLCTVCFAATPGDVVTSFPTPAGCPSGLAWDGKYLWLADWREAMLYKIDPQTGEVVTSLPAPCHKPQGLAWGKERLFVSDIQTFVNEYQAGFVYVFNPETETVEASFATPGSSPRGLGYDGRYLLLADDKEDKIYRLNPDDGTTISYFQAPDGNSQGLSYDGEYLWISDRIKDQIYMVTADDGIVVMTLYAPDSYTVGLAWDGRHLWNVDFAADRIYKIDVSGDGTHSVCNVRKTNIEFTHTLRNHGPGTIEKAEIYFAVPEKTLNHQELLGEVQYMPPADRFEADQWGQKIAVYTFDDVGPGEMVGARYSVDAYIGELRFYIHPDCVGSLENIPEEITEKYLKEGSRYFIDEPIIRETVEQILDGESNPYWIARKFFEYEIEKVEYELAGGWDIAPTILKRGSGSCSEYSFLYIALCRAAGLPARYQAGVSHRGDDACVDNVYHRWVEVYLPNYGWVPVDPSRGDQPTPAGRAASFGMLSNSLFITTHGGGDSEYLGWSYNSNSKSTCKGKCEIVEDTYAIWEPISSAKTDASREDETCISRDGKTSK
jgi:hypothetical protein